MTKTDPPKTDIAYPTIYNWNGRLNDHNRLSMQLMLFGIKFDDLNRNISKVIE